MKWKRLVLLVCGAIASTWLLGMMAAQACTSIVVSRGASRDGSVMVTYSADAPFMPRLLRVPGGNYPAGTMVEVRGWEDDEVRGKVRQAEHTYTLVGLMNEHQLSLGETTTGGRPELVNRQGQLDYDGLILLTLQRAKTAREAISIIDALCTEYGYGSSGETFSIADKNEAWIMELIGKGPSQKGIVWVAACVPEGTITSHANMSRITTFPLNEPESWRYSPDVISFAIEKGFYKTLKMQPVIEETAAKLATTDPALMNSFLTSYSVSTGDAVFRCWQELASAILTRHVDGYIKDPKGSPKAPGYSKDWLREVVKRRPDQFKLPKNGQPAETDH